MPETSARARRPGITRDRVTDRAIAIVDAEGLSALSMRRLARDLGIDPMSLYNHVSDKADLLDAMQVRLLADLGVEAGDPSDLDGYLRGVGRAYRRVTLAHPAAMPVVFTRAITAPEALRPVEHILETLGAAGVSGGPALTIVATLFGFLNGYLLSETSNRPDLAIHRPADDPIVDSSVSYRALEDPDLDRMRAMGEALVDADPGEMFETSLGIVVGGIVGYLSRT